jgi:hypothetical protein
MEEFTMSRLSTGVLVVALTLALAIPANLAWAKNSDPQLCPPHSQKIDPNPGVLAPNSKPCGMDYGEWGAAWWQWVILGTKDNQVLFDTTGEFAQVNQILSGSVFFLAGTWTGTAVVRNVTVPAGKAFFLPIANWVLTYPEDVPPANRNSEKEAEAFIRKTLNENFNGSKAEELVCIVDGVPVKHPKTGRAQSPAFSMYYPPGCFEVEVDASLITGDRYQVGLHYPTVSDGYWVMLAPLPVGQHTIQIQAGPPGSLWQDVTYNLTVAGD